MRDQIYRVAIPGLSFTHATHYLLTLLAVEDVFHQYSCWSIFCGGAFRTNVQRVVSSGCGVVGEEREAWVIRVIIFFVSFPFIVDRGIKSAVGEWLL